MKTLFRRNGHTEIKVDFKIDKYFSITGDIYSGGECVTSGCIHDEIKESFPESIAAKVFIDLHLSDLNGAPMYAVENGAYFMGLTEYKDHNGESLPSVRLVSNHFRISTLEARALIKTVKSKQELVGYIGDNFTSKWKNEANNALRLYEMLE